MSSPSCLSNSYRMNESIRQQQKAIRIRKSIEYIFTQPLHYGQGVTQGKFLSKASVKLEFFFSLIGYLTKAKEPSLLYYECNSINEVNFA